MSYPCRMSDPFLPTYDFEQLENEPDPIPVTPPPSYGYWQKMLDEAFYEAMTGKAPAPINPAPAPKTVADLIRRGTIGVSK